MLHKTREMNSKKKKHKLYDTNSLDLFMSESPNKNKDDLYQMQHLHCVNNHTNSSSFKSNSPCSNEDTHSKSSQKNLFNVVTLPTNKMSKKKQKLKMQCNESLSSATNESSMFPSINRLTEDSKGINLTEVSNYSLHSKSSLDCSSVNIDETAIRKNTGGQSNSLAEHGLSTFSYPVKKEKSTKSVNFEDSMECLDKMSQRIKKKRKKNTKVSLQDSVDSFSSVKYLKNDLCELPVDECTLGNLLQEEAYNPLNTEQLLTASKVKEGQKKCLENSCHKSVDTSSDKVECSNDFSPKVRKVRKHFKEYTTESCKGINKDFRTEILNESRFSPHCKKERDDELHRDEYQVSGSYQSDTNFKRKQKYLSPCSALLREKSDCSSEDIKEINYSSDIDIPLDELDMTEAPLKFTPPELHTIGRMASLNADQKNYLISNGTVIKSGKWSKKEDKILRRNWKRFIKKFKVSDPVVLLGIHEGRKRRLEKFIIAKKFYYRLAKDLNNRTLFSVYIRARKLFNPYNVNRKLTEEEISKLFKLHNKYGNDWTRIGKILNLSAGKCLEGIRWHRKTGRGHWTMEEEEMLVESLQNILGTEDLNRVFRSLPWEHISKQVTTRNSAQCRHHWLQTLCWKFCFDTPRQKWNERNSACLIYQLYHEAPEDESAIDWDSVYEKFKIISPSYAALRGKFLKLKKHVPGYLNKDYEDIIAYLYHLYLPTLLKKLDMTHEDLLESIEKVSD